VHYILCKDKKWIETLEQEMTSDLTKDFETVPGLPLIKCSNNIDLRNKYLAFSSTVLLNAIELPEDSVSKQSAAVVECILKKFPDGAKVNYHVYSLTDKYGILETGRAEILKDKIHKALKKNKIFCLRKDFDRSLPFIQVCILTDRSLAVSILNQQEMKDYHSLVSPFVGGFSNVEEDKKAPSRAFKKIVEAQRVLGVKIQENETLVDLGASPGGWTYIARKNGAKVIALDRSELREDLMADDMVTFLKSDAFKFQTEERIDWVVSDIICTPERILELIDLWVNNKKCSKFIFTIKFQGNSDYGILKQFKEVASLCDYQVIIKQLNVNKNEVTIMGRAL